MRKNKQHLERIEIRVLGASDFRVGGRGIGLSTEALFALGLYLAVRAGDRIPRDELLSVFWPEGTDDNRRHALRQLMYRLRQRGFQLDEDGEMLYLDPDRVECDLKRCLVPDWPLHAGPNEIESALTLGPTFSSRLPGSFLDWYDELRSHVNRQACAGALRQVGQARKEGRWSALDSWAAKILRIDPLNEEATLARAESAAMAGSKIAALEILDNYLAELGEHAAELGRPAISLRKRISERRVDWSRRSPTDVTLEGRASIMARVGAFVDSASRGAGGTLALVGPPGIGKTRLITEAANFAQLNGTRVFSIRGDHAQSAHSFSSLRELTAQVIDAPGSLGAHPSHISLLRDFASSTESRIPVFGGQLEEAALQDALAETITAVSERIRVAVIVDDAHNIDDSTRGVLHHCIRRTARQKVAWLFTSRSQGQSWPPRENMIEVPPLEAEASQALALQIGTVLNRGLTAEDAAVIARRAGGNPLFLREMAAHHSRGVRGRAVPESLQELILARLVGLPDKARKLLRIAALLGNAATFARCQRASGLEASETSDLLVLLEHEGIVYVDQHSALALHECWQHVVTDSLTPVAAASLAHQCASAILEHDRGVLDTDDLNRAADLFARSGQRREALTCLLRSFDRLLARGLHDEAESVLRAARSHAIRHGSSLGIASREADLLLARGEFTRVLECLGSIPATAADAMEQGESATDWVFAIAHRYDALGKTQLYNRHGTDHLTAAANCAPAVPLARHYAAFVGARNSLWTDDRKGLEHFYSIGNALTRELGHSLSSGFLDLLYLGEHGTKEEFLRACNRQVTLEQAPAPLRLVRQSMRFRAIGLRMHGCIREASTLAVEVYETCVRQGQIDIAANNAEFLAFIHLDQDRLDEASAWLDRGAAVDAEAKVEVRSKGLLHAKMRLLLQRGMPEEVVTAMEPRLRELSQDKLSARRTSELLTFALAQLMRGEDFSTVSELVAEARATLDSRPHTFLDDYPSELLLRILLLAGHEDLRIVRDQLIARRSANFDRPLAPFFSNLNSTGTFEWATL